MSDLSERLIQERKRLGATQGALATAGRVARSAQANYEAGNRQPDADYLAGVAELGVDVLYVVTGRRAGEIDLTVLGMCEAALRNLYAEKRLGAGPDPPGAVRLSALTKIYNAALARLSPGASAAAVVREEAARYISFVDDPSDPKLLIRALFRGDSGAEQAADDAKRVTVKGSGRARVAGRDFHEGGDRRGGKRAGRHEKT